jgi:Ser-tRNA(Ala) deacylase AlaX
MKVIILNGSPKAEGNTDMEKELTLNEHNKQEYEPAHTAEHLLNQTMIRMFGCERSRNAHIERKKSKINYNLDSCPTPEQVAEIERRMNELIAEDLPVTFEFVTRDNIPEGVVLDKLPEDASETLRIVRIGDYDICACIGSHVKSTKEIGTFKITSTSYNDGSFRIVYKVKP